MSMSALSASDAKNEGDKGGSEKKHTIIFLGDSITAGYGLKKSEAYPALIEKLATLNDLEWNCINAGLSGDTTSGGVRRVKLLVRRPLDVIVIALGGNDGLRGIAPEATVMNLTTIIETVQKAHPKATIILAGIEVPKNMGEDYEKKFLATFVTVAKKKEVVCYPNLIAGIAGDMKFNQEDLIHPNQEGQKVIAKKLFQTIHTALSATDPELPN